MRILAPNLKEAFVAGFEGAVAPLFKPSAWELTRERTRELIVWELTRERRPELTRERSPLGSSQGSTQGN